MKSGKTRAALYGIVALYLLHIAYDLFQSRLDTETTMTPVARWLFIVFFAAAAIALGVLTVREWKRGDEEEAQKDGEDSLK